MKRPIDEDFRSCPSGSIALIDALYKYADHLEKQNAKMLEALKKFSEYKVSYEDREEALKLIQKAEGGRDE